MSMDRYIAVCHSFSPHLSKLRRGSSVMVVTAVVWAVSLGFSFFFSKYAVVIGLEPHCKCR